MGDAQDRLLVKLANQGEVYVMPYIKVKQGETIHVDGHWRKVRPGESTITVVSHPSVLKLLGLPDTVKAGNKEQDVPATSTSKNVRPSDAVDVVDQRDKGEPPLRVDKDALDMALNAAEVKIGPDTKIKLRLRTGDPGQFGLAQRLNENEYRVVVYVKKGKGTKDSHMYVINNSLVHELRHVQQHQQDPDMSAKYQMQNATVGYGKNKYEIDARYYGRLADHLGVKDTGPAGKALGKIVWAFQPV